MAKGLKTGGRRKGVPNKVTAAKQAEIVASGLSPLDFMLQLLRDPEQPYAMRLDAAKGCASYVHPKLANIELSGNKEKPLTVNVLRFSDTSGINTVPDHSDEAKTQSGGVEQKEHRKKA